MIRLMSKQPKPKDVIETFINDIRSVRHSPRFQIIVTHGVLELLVNTLVEQTCKHQEKIIESTRDFPHAVKLVLLSEKGIINDSQFKFIDNFRKLRNSAAHGAQFVLKEEMLKPFANLNAVRNPAYHDVKTKLEK